MRNVHSKALILLVTEIFSISFLFHQVFLLKAKIMNIWPFICCFFFASARKCWRLLLFQRLFRRKIGALVAFGNDIPTYMQSNEFQRNLPYRTTHPPKWYFNTIVLKFLGIFFSETAWFYGLLDFTVTRPPTIPTSYNAIYTNKMQYNTTGHLLCIPYYTIYLPKRFIYSIWSLILRWP